MEFKGAPIPSHSMAAGRTRLEHEQIQQQQMQLQQKHSSQNQQYLPGVSRTRPSTSNSAFHQPPLKPEYGSHQIHSQGYRPLSRQTTPSNGVTIVAGEHQGAPTAPLPTRRQFNGIISPPPTFHSNPATTKGRVIHRPTSVGRSHQPMPNENLIGHEPFSGSRPSSNNASHRPVQVSDFFSVLWNDSI